MSPRRGDRVTVPPPPSQWDVRFATGDAATGWEELCRHALANTRRCLEILQAQPRSTRLVAGLRLASASEGHRLTLCGQVLVFHFPGVVHRVEAGVAHDER